MIMSRSVSSPRLCLLNLIILIVAHQTFTQTPPDPTKWWQYPPPFNALALANYQATLQSKNLIDSYTEKRKMFCRDPKIGLFGGAPRRCSRQGNKARSANGECNDFDNPAAGSYLYRFGRNIPLDSIPTDHCSIYHPNPRLISRKLMARKEFIPATSINMLIVGWIQFMNHDWFDHGTNDMRRQIKVKLTPDDPDFTGQTMNITRTRADGCSSPAYLITLCKFLPVKLDLCRHVKSYSTFQNTVTHWWDGSQLYGSDTSTLRKVRSYTDGKLKINDNDRLPIDPVTGLPITGLNNNWWVGLAMMHFLWTKEHNYICEILKERNPWWNDEKLFQTARLITSAVIAKIHTLEWTGAILNNDIAKLGLKMNWYGVSVQEIAGGNATLAAWLAQNYPELANGVPGAVGNAKNNHGVPFSLTEEFVAVYRFHPLLPDNIEIKDHKTDTIVKQYNLKDVGFSDTEIVFQENSMEDIYYSFGNAHPGAMVLHNYPDFLRNLKLPSSSPHGEGTIDLATIDIMRDRERGIPRYNEFRRLIHLSTISTFEELTPDPQLAQEIRIMYNDDVEQIDLLVGSLAESPRPNGFGFSDTFNRIFVVMAKRRLETDRFFTDDYTEEFYTKWGLEYVDKTYMKAILIRHYPQLKSHLENVENVFIPWKAQGPSTK